MSRSSVLGFTVVELVAIISIVGILVAIAVPRFFNNRSMEPIFARDSLVSIFRLGQQRAMSSANVDLFLDESLGEYVVAVRENGVNVESLLVTDVSLTAGDVSNYSSCSSLDVSREIDFDARGEIASSFPSGVQVCIDNENAICISAAGFSYFGQCE